MLEAIFQEGILSLTLAGLTQWDYGQKLTIKGLTVSSALEVHFSNNAEKEAIVMSATKSGSDIITEIPNVLLEKDKDITAWVYTDDGQSGETIRTIVLKVTPRIKPADYISENNAGEVIDYVAKAEEYANSAQESAKSAQDKAEQVQANTDIVKDILANVPDFDSYEKLAEHNKLLYDGLYVKGETYKGIASNKGIKLHKVVGKTEQETTNGYQLLNYTDFSVKNNNGIKASCENGLFILSGTAISSAFFNIPLIQTNGIIKVSLNNTITNDGVSFKFANESLADVTSAITFNEVNKKIEIELGNNASYLVIRVLSGVTLSNFVFKPMIYQDGDGTWEPYTGGKPAPNLDYAMPIDNVEISKLVSYGKNIISSIPTGGMVYARCTYEYKDVTKELTIKATANDAYIGEVSSLGNTYKTTNGTLYLIPKNAIKVYFRSEKGVFNSVYATFYDENKKSLGYAKVGSYSVPEGAKYVSFRIGVNPSTNETSYTDKLYASFEEISGDYVTPHHEEVETSLTLAQDDIYQNETITIARKQVVLDGSSDESWLNFVANTRVQCQLDTVIRANYSVNVNGYCNRAVYRKTGNANELQNNEFTIVSSKDFGGARLIIRIPSDISTLEEWKTRLSTHNLVVEYELATPTTEEFKVPTIPSYYPFTNVSTDNDLTTDIEWELLANSDNSLYQEELEKRIQALEAQILGL